jgi:hypothetical protein
VRRRRGRVKIVYKRREGGREGGKARNKVLSTYIKNE